MVALSLIGLCVFIFGAYAYGVTTVYALRNLPIWRRRDEPPRKPVFDPVLLALCSVTTVWFITHATMEFRLLIGRSDSAMPSIVELVAFVLTFAFPPLIMHTVLQETENACMDAAQRRRWTWPIYAMYALAAATASYLLAAVYDLLPRVPRLGSVMGLSAGLLFTLCSVYCIVLMMRRSADQPRRTPSPDQRGLQRTMIGLFVLMIPLFFALTFLREQQLLTAALDRVTRSLPMFFLIASVYFEDRFEFYDLIVKRATMLVASLVLVGGYLAFTLRSIEQLPGGPARPWLIAVTLLPLVLVLPWIHTRLGRWLDRMWFGREFTPVEAVKQVLSAMQPATDEPTLAAATEARLSDMFHTPIRLLLDAGPAPPNAVVETIAPISDGGTPLRVVVSREPGTRPLLSEDMALLRSLAGVFNYMLENVRLQRRRQEQDQLAHELRLQTSRSELKALRAQINPHFLFNALNAIASLIHTDPTRADAAVEQLAEVFRYTLRRSEQEWAPLDQELAFARAYLDVEQARFGRRLTFAIDASPSAARAQVPSMVVHTLVENAVKHGISQVRGAGRIEIHAHSDGDTLVVEVRDSGPGIEASRSKRSEGPSTGLGAGESFGLRSIHDRLRGHFGERASLSLTRDTANGLTIARVEMPLIRTQDERDTSLLSRR
jgi:signal transduction histidine kinase